MPNPAPQRRENRAQLDPQGVRLERALLARAEALIGEAEQLRTVQANGMQTVENPDVLLRISAEFSALAQELHFW